MIVYAALFGSWFGLLMMAALDSVNDGSVWFVVGTSWTSLCYFIQEKLK